jgi:hypothetical protein
MKSFEVEAHPIFGVSLGVEYIPEADEGTGESALAIDLVVVRVLFFWGGEE